MSGDIAKAKRYRERAQGLRGIAADLPSGNTQRLILGIALEYDRLAGLLEQADPADDPAKMLAALKRPDYSGPKDDQ
jgi:hypothetical protein